MKNRGPLPVADASLEMNEGGGGHQTNAIELLSTVRPVYVEIVDWGTEPRTTLVLTPYGYKRGASGSSVAVVPGDLPQLELYACGGGSLELDPAHPSESIDAPPAVVGVGHPPADAGGLDSLPHEGGEMGAE